MGFKPAYKSTMSDERRKELRSEAIAAMKAGDMDLARSAPATARAQRRASGPGRSWSPAPRSPARRVGRRGCARPEPGPLPRPTSSPGSAGRGRGSRRSAAVGPSGRAPPGRAPSAPAGPPPPTAPTASEPRAARTPPELRGRSPARRGDRRRRPGRCAGRAPRSPRGRCTGPPTRRSSAGRIHGEEDLLRIEALDTLRAAAKKQGYLNREV